MSRYITTIDDLRVYVDELMGREGTYAVVVRTADQLARDPDAPAWGDDWADYVLTHDIWDTEVDE